MTRDDINVIGTGIAIIVAVLATYAACIIPLAYSL